MRILTRNIAIREEQNWLETLKNAISDPKILLKTLNLPVEDFAEDIAARKLFAMRVPLPFVEKMEKGNPKDPLFFASDDCSTRIYRSGGVWPRSFR